MSNKILLIRKATESDLPSIFSLVEELAEFEHARNELFIDLNYYVQEFNKGTFESIVAEYDGRIVGTCVYYMTFSTWKGRMLYLEDFIVAKDFRKQGVGQKLYDKFIQEAKLKDAQLVKWQVLDWNEGAIRFYVRNNAIIEKEWYNCKVLF